MWKEALVGYEQITQLKQFFSENRYASAYVWLKAIHYKGSVSFKDLAEYMEVSNSAVSQMVDKLHGFVDVRRVKADGRCRTINITSKGISRIRRIEFVTDEINIENHKKHVKVRENERREAQKQDSKTVAIGV